MNNDNKDTDKQTTTPHGLAGPGDEDKEDSFYTTKEKLEKDMKWHEMVAKHEMEEQDRRNTLLDKLDKGISLDADDRAQQRRQEARVATRLKDDPQGTFTLLTRQDHKLWEENPEKFYENY